MPFRILLVDDNPVVRVGIRSLLASEIEYTVCGEAVDGIDAIEKAKQLRPDAILMDVSMPRMDGLQATAAICADQPDTRIIIVSQNDPAVVTRQAASAGAHGFVPKLSLAKDLIPAIVQVFHQYGPPPRSKQTPASRRSWLVGGGEMGALIREKDWCTTPLGDIEGWPQSLRTSLNIMLNSQHPMWIGWGSEMTFLYNDPYIKVLSLAKHPISLGLSAREVWTEIWDICGPLSDKVFSKGEASFLDDVRLFMNRGGRLEETYYSFSYSPIHDESGRVRGLFCPSAETTAKVLHARRLRTLAELSAKALLEKSAQAACASCLSIIARNPDDVPFSFLYLVEAGSKVGHLEGTAGLSEVAKSALPQKIPLEDPAQDGSQPCHINEVFQSSQPKVMAVRAMRDLPLGPAGHPVNDAIALPLTSSAESKPLGVLVAAINPTRSLDPEYRTFFRLLADQVATAIQNATAAEQERKHAEALAKIDRAKTVFFNNVSHEFRTPLALMLGPLEELLAKSHTDLSPAAKGQLEMVARNGVRLLRLVNTLLDFSRIEAGRIEANYQPTDVATFTAELASAFRSATERAGLQLRIECHPFSESVYVDRDMWEKIVLNLVSNAFKFTFDGEIVVSVRRLGHSVELAVHDTGVGIPAEEIPRLFERFHRIETTRSRTHEGSGIGLALVQELVKLHGGTLRAASVLGRGTTFTVSLPLGKEHLPADRVGTDRSLASTAVGAAPFVQEAMRWLPEDQPGGAEELPPHDQMLAFGCPPADEQAPDRPCVLVADDNADMRQYIVRLLSERFNVTAVPDGQAALVAAREHTPDLVLSDVMMPGLDGLALLRELRADGRLKEIPIILLSARAGEENRLEGVQAGADDYLVKPFSARELKARVEAHIKLHRTRQQAKHKQQQLTAEYETLLNQAPLGIYVVDSNFRIRQVNPVALPVFEAIPDFMGRDFDEVVRLLVPDERASEIAGVFRRTLERGQSHQVAEDLVPNPHGGDDTYYEWRVDRIPLPDGTNGVVCYFRDISQAVKVRQAYRQLAESLEGEVRSRTSELEKRNLEALAQSELVREFSQRLLQTQDAERRHIARELHDSAGQTLTVLSIQEARIAERLKTERPDLLKEMEEVQNLTLQLNQEIRTTSYLLHPPLLDETGLGGALEWYVDGFNARSGMDMALDIDADFPRFASDIELALFRIVQEALTNIHRHSGSKKGAIRIVHTGDEVQLEIQDLGKGILPEKLGEIRSGRAGVGFRGMRERVRQLHGRFHVESDSSGTRVSVILPRPHQDSRTEAACPGHFSATAN